jgi:hypothetical protein
MWKGNFDFGYGIVEEFVNLKRLRRNGHLFSEKEEKSAVFRATEFLTGLLELLVNDPRKL